MDIRRRRRRRLLLQLQIIFIVIVNITLTTTEQCPSNYEFKNGLCYFIGNRCPDGYHFHTDGFCYPINQKPCPFENITATTSAPKPITEEVPTTATTTMLPTTTTTTTTRTTPPPLIDQLLHCPSGTIFIENNCRRIICSLGEYHKGHCLHPACPPGLVWRGKSCKAPAYITTIIEIDNIITNDFNENPFALEKIATNEIVFHTSTTTTRKPSTTPAHTTDRTTSRTTKKEEPSNIQANINGCCTVVTPRICKKYGEKWVCFNRRHKLCDSRICTAPVVYLKAHEIKYDPPILVMPPNPPIDSCLNSSCNNTDCSGCASNHPEQCSSYCYRYMCPEATCNYMDLNTYCSYFPRQFGCFKEDGCLWNWC